MDHPLFDLVDRRIRAAQEAGDFDDLPGAGRRLPDCDDPENAVFDRLVRDNGGVPEVVALSRELARLRAELAAATDRTARRDILKEMSMAEARLELARKPRARSR